MPLRKHHLLAIVAALGVLLHVGTAAAQVFCAMTGMVMTACCCEKDERPDGPVLEQAGGDCCRDALGAPTVDLQQQPAPLSGPALAAAWAQAVLPEPAAIPARSEGIPSGLSPPLLGLQTIVLLR